MNKFISFVYLSLLIIIRIADVLTHIPELHIEHEFHYTLAVSTHLKKKSKEQESFIYSPINNFIAFHHFKIQYYSRFLKKLL